MEGRQERSRAANFSREEEKLLLMIVNDHGEIIHSKKTDAVTNAMKIEEWFKIQEEFNSHHLGQLRDASTLRRKYENIKRDVKKKMTLEKIILTETGEDPEKNKLFSEEETPLLEVIMPEAVGFQNTYGDNNHMTRENHNLISDLNAEETLGNDDIVDEVETSQDHDPLEVNTTSTHQPQFLTTHSNTGQQATMQPGFTLQKSRWRYEPTQPSSLARSHIPAMKKWRRGHPLDKMTAWASAKANSAEQEHGFKRELHEQKKRHLEEEHELKKRLLEQELRHAEERQSWLRVEHLAKMQRINTTNIQKL